LWKRSAATDFIAVKESKAFNDMSGYQIFRERGLDPALHRKHQKKLKITWSSHVIFY